MVSDTYDPQAQLHREALAGFILSSLHEAGFSEVTKHGSFVKEMVFEREVKDNIWVKVYTTVCEDEGRISVRMKDKDAIRVIGVYRSSEGKERGIIRAKRRVFRVGKVEDIPERMLERMREVWRLCMVPESCKCGAPKFKSKKGNEVCADLCWTK